MRENLKEDFWEMLSLKKKKRYIGKPNISFPLDLAMPSYDIYNCRSCLATKREAKLRPRTKRAELKETRLQIPDTLLLTNAGAALSLTFFFFFLIGEKCLAMLYWFLPYN